MKLSKKVLKFQEGGPMPGPQGGAPAPGQEQGGAPAGAEGGQGGDPTEQIIQAAMQAVQAQDGNLALQVCQALVELTQSGGGAPEQPVYRSGGAMVKRAKR